MIKSKIVTINDDGQDKKFLITRMSASATEDWAIETFFALANAGVEIPEANAGVEIPEANAGVEIPEEVSDMGFAGIARIGLQALGKVSYEKAKPLLDKMMSCVQAIPNPDDERVVRQLVDSDIQDFRNRLKLRKEVFSLHVDFS